MRMYTTRREDYRISLMLLKDRDIRDKMRKQQQRLLQCRQRVMEMEHVLLKRRSLLRNKLLRQQVLGRFPRMFFM